MSMINKKHREMWLKLQMRFCHEIFSLFFFSKYQEQFVVSFLLFSLFLFSATHLVINSSCKHLHFVLQPCDKLPKF